ncbi:uncharacterized protein LOC144451060 [Glandiceps talaboti]
MMQARLFLLVFMVTFYVAVPLKTGKFPLNKYEIILLANELTSQECRELVEALYNPTFAMEKKPTGINVPMVPCIELLHDWNENSGMTSSWTQVTHRLYQIGRKDISEALAEAVLAEKRMRLEKYFLNNPFKKEDRSQDEAENMADTKVPGVVRIVKRDIEGDLKDDKNEVNKSMDHVYIDDNDDKSDVMEQYLHQYRNPARKELILAVVIPMFAVPGVIAIVIFTIVMLMKRQTRPLQPSRQLITYENDAFDDGEFVADTDDNETLTPTRPQRKTEELRPNRTKNSSNKRPVLPIHWIDQSEDVYPFTHGSNSNHSNRPHTQDQHKMLKHSTKFGKNVQRERYSVMLPLSSSEDSEEENDTGEC